MYFLFVILVSGIQRPQILFEGLFLTQLKMKILHWYKKAMQRKWMFRYLFHSIYFNFHYLPFKQAVRLPILVYKPKFIKLRGKVIIDSPVIKTGMIQLGTFQVSLFPNSGIVYENYGGTVIFKGRCKIGNASAVSVGPRGNLIFGNDFIATASLKLTSYWRISFGENVLCGWDCLFADTDFHQLTFREDKSPVKSYGEIWIGKGCWFALKTIVMKGSNIPDYCVMAANSLLNKSYTDIEPYSLLAGQPATVRKTGVYLDRVADAINYDG